MQLRGVFITTSNLHRRLLLLLLLLFRFIIESARLEMTFQVTQLSLPCASVAFMATKHMQCIDLTTKMFVQHCCQGRGLAHWTSTSSFFYPVSCCFRNVITTAFCEVRLEEYATYHWTVVIIRRLLNKVMLRYLFY